MYINNKNEVWTLINYDGILGIICRINNYIFYPKYDARNEYDFLADV